MHKVRDYNVIYDNAVSLVIYESGHFTHVCKTHEWPHYITTMECLIPYN
jgi:hypothetical protein